MSKTVLLALALATVGSPALAQAVPQGADRIALGRKYALWMYAGASDSLYAAMSPDMQKDLGSPDEILNRADQLASRAGSETEVVSEKVVKRNGQWQYWRTAKFTQAPEPLTIRFVIADDGTIVGIGMNPASQPPPVDPDSPPPSA